MQNQTHLFFRQRTVLNSWCNADSEVYQARSRYRMQVVRGYYEETKQLVRRPRLAVIQSVNLACVVFSALMLWRFLILCTGTESPVVVILSGSMEPGIRRGDVLLLHMPKTINTGDISVFKLQSRDIPIVHRAVSVHERNSDKLSVLTKGDNNPVNDRGLYDEDMLFLENEHMMGVAYFILPQLGMPTILINDYPILKKIAFLLIAASVIYSKE